MESQLANHHDAEIILKLYDLRREAVLRKARHWMTFEFSPKSAEEFLSVIQGAGTQENAYFRQATSYWEMAASLVNHGAVNADLFIDSNGEGLFIFAKFHEFRAEFEAKMGMPFMRQTAVLLERHPAARERFELMVKRIRERAR